MQVALGVIGFELSWFYGLQGLEPTVGACLKSTQKPYSAIGVSKNWWSILGG